MAFFQCSTIGRAPSSAWRIPGCYREHLLATAGERAMTVCCFASYPIAKGRFTQWTDIFQCAVTHCPSSQVPWSSVQCILHCCADERCHAISERTVLLWGWYELDVLITQGPLKLPVETAWSHQHNNTADLGVKKCSDYFSHFWWGGKAVDHWTPIHVTDAHSQCPLCKKGCSAMPGN